VNVPDNISIRFIRESDLAAFKALRLEALREHPEAFGTDYEEDAGQSESVWKDRVGKAAGDPSGSIVLADAGNELAGMVGVWRGTGVKTRHEANIWGVYVRPKYRGLKLTDGMIGEALGWCRGGDVRIVRLGVGTYNTAAIRCYQRCGFQVCGISPEKIRVGDIYYDELLMWRRV
jgi:ribosomal protein S18 acetylase RimI-like enzyme